MAIGDPRDHQPHVDVIQQHEKDCEPSQYVYAVNSVPAMRSLGARIRAHPRIIAAFKTFPSVFPRILSMNERCFLRALGFLFTAPRSRPALS
jgi:hypothetical protein